MTKKRFKRGDHVSWNSEAGRVRAGSPESLLPGSRSKATQFMRARMIRSTRSKAIRPITSRCIRGRRSGSWLAEEFLLLTDDDADDDCRVQDDPADAGKVN
jgi:hypothetical protein